MKSGDLAALRPWLLHLAVLAAAWTAAALAVLAVADWQRRTRAAGAA